jgi:hypothetical protein
VVSLTHLQARAKARLEHLSSQAHERADEFHRDALAFFGRVPEPPVYRRRDDPLRARAAALLEEAETLLARAMRLGEPVALFAPALEAHFHALWLTAQLQVEAAEPVWHQALVLERAATASLRAWSRSDENQTPVFDPLTRVSRFDPSDEARLTAKLACPWCRKANGFQLATRVATHRLRCPLCAHDFVAYVVEARSRELIPVSRGRRRYIFRVEEPSHIQTRIEFEDAANAELGASRRDVVAFLYAPEHALRGVLNLSTSRVLWLSSPSCFVATVAFGEGAFELQVLRAFRDQVLEQWELGRRFIAWYYRHGPHLAAVVNRRPMVRWAVRGALRLVVWVIR